MGTITWFKVQHNINKKKFVCQVISTRKKSLSWQRNLIFFNNFERGLPKVHSH